MIAVIVLAGFVVAALAFIGWGSVLIRRHNRRLDRLRNLQPITPMRFRHLNVVDPCDRTPGCHARSHEPTCFRVRNRPLDAIDNEAD